MLDIITTTAEIIIAAIMPLCLKSFKLHEANKLRVISVKGGGCMQPWPNWTLFSGQSILLPNQHSVAELITTDVAVQLDMPVPRLHCGSSEWADLQSPLWKGHHLSQTAPHQTAALIVSSLVPSGWKGQTAIFRGVTKSPKMTPTVSLVLLPYYLVVFDQAAGLRCGWCIYSNSSRMNVKYSGWKWDVKDQTITITFIHLCSVII